MTRRRLSLASGGWRHLPALASDGPSDSGGGVDSKDPFTLPCPKCHSTRTHIREVDVTSKTATIICLDCRAISVVPFSL